MEEWHLPTRAIQLSPECWALGEAVSEELCKAETALQGQHLELMHKSWSRHSDLALPSDWVTKLECLHVLVFVQYSLRLQHFGTESQQCLRWSARFSPSEAAELPPHNNKLLQFWHQYFDQFILCHNWTNSNMDPCGFPGLVTTIMVVKSLIAILANHPELQTRMQKEIDHVLGEAEPRLEDRDKLHYVNAVSKGKGPGPGWRGSLVLVPVAGDLLSGKMQKTSLKSSAKFVWTHVLVFVTSVVVFKGTVLFPFCRFSMSSSVTCLHNRLCSLTRRWKRENWEATRCPKELRYGPLKPRQNQWKNTREICNRARTICLGSNEFLLAKPSPICPTSKWWPVCLGSRFGATSSPSTTTLSTGRTPGPSSLRGSWMTMGSWLGLITPLDGGQFMLPVWVSPHKACCFFPAEICWTFPCVLCSNKWKNVFFQSDNVHIWSREKSVCWWGEIANRKCRKLVCCSNSWGGRNLLQFDPCCVLKLLQLTLKLFLLCKTLIYSISGSGEEPDVPDPDQPLPELPVLPDRGQDGAHPRPEVLWPWIRSSYARLWDQGWGQKTWAILICSGWGSKTLCVNLCVKLEQFKCCVNANACPFEAHVSAVKHKKGQKTNKKNSAQMSTPWSSPWQFSNSLQLEL